MCANGPCEVDCWLGILDKAYIPRERFQFYCRVMWQGCFVRRACGVCVFRSFIFDCSDILEVPGV